tara:strand:+ start:2809 stop:3429 length:621 start_codon:yes stop_codon:yes gene_type:complete
MQKNNKTLPNWLIIALFSVWIAATLLGLWWFQQANLKSFIAAKDDTRFYQPQAVETLLAPYLDAFPPALENQQTLLHFWRPDCLCNRVSQRHFSRLLSDFSSEELRIIIIAHPNSRAEEIDNLQALNGDRLSIVRAKDDLLALPSSPSLALMNADNKLGYFGPYGFGAFCTSNEDGFLTSVVNQMASDKPLNTFTNVIGKGCFCSW